MTKQIITLDETYYVNNIDGDIDGDFDGDLINEYRIQQQHKDFKDNNIYHFNVEENRVGLTLLEVFEAHNLFNSKEVLDRLEVLILDDYGNINYLTNLQALNIGYSKLPDDIQNYLLECRVYLYSFDYEKLPEESFQIVLYDTGIDIMHRCDITIKRSQNKNCYYTDIDYLNGYNTTVTTNFRCSLLNANDVDTIDELINYNKLEIIGNNVKKYIHDYLSIVYNGQIVVSMYPSFDRYTGFGRQQSYNISAEYMSNLDDVAREYIIFSMDDENMQILELSVFDYEKLYTDLRKYIMQSQLVDNENDEYSKREFKTGRLPNNEGGFTIVGE
jgi:hypothetical protein